MNRGAQGWTLVETMVAVGLFAFVMGIVTMILLSTSRVTRAQAARSLRQASLQSTMRHVERVLQRAPVIGVKWIRTAPDGAVLAAHCLRDGPLTSATICESYWRCLVWEQQSGKMFMGRSLDAGFPPPPARYEPMPDAQIQAILQAETPYTGSRFDGHQIADRVTDFSFELMPGPLYKIELELDVPPGDNADLAAVKERQRASVTLHPRNRV